MSEEINNKVNKALDNMRAPFPSKEASWDQLMLRIESQEQPKKRNYSKAIISIAASIAVLVGLMFFQSSNTISIETQSAEHRSITLPDGSEVILNAQSTLSYDADDFNESRNLELDGEAFFQVQKGSSFKVTTDQGTITVLGTSFNVRDRKNLFEVSCETGKVAVENGAEQVILTPGLATNNKSGKLAPAFERSMAQAWTNGSFSFDDEQLDYVFNEVERQFGVSINRPDFTGMYFTGEFDSSDLESALNVVCQPMGLDFTISADMNINVTLKY